MHMSDASFTNLLICIDLRGTNWHLKAKTMKKKKKMDGKFHNSKSQFPVSQRLSPERPLLNLWHPCIAHSEDGVQTSFPLYPGLPEGDSVIFDHGGLSVPSIYLNLSE